MSQNNTITGQNQDNQYEIGETIQWEANPTDDYSFYGWQDENGNLVGKTTSYEAIVTNDTPTDNMYAVFTPKSQNDEYELTVLVDDCQFATCVVDRINGGSVREDSYNIDGSTESWHYTVDSNSKYIVTVTPIASEDDYVFNGWYKLEGSVWVFVTDELKMYITIGEHDDQYKAVFSQKNQQCHVTYQETQVTRFTNETVNASSLYRMSLTYTLNDTKVVEYLVSCDGPFQHTVHDDIYVPYGTEVTFLVEYQNPSVTSAGLYGPPYGNYLDVDVRNWTINGRNYGARAMQVSQFMIESDTVVSCELMNCMMTVYVELANEGYSDSYWGAKPYQMIDGTKYYIHMQGVKKTGFVGINAYPTGGYKVDEARDENGNIIPKVSTALAKYDYQIRPLNDKEGNPDPTIPRFIRLFYKATGYNVNVEVYKHKGNITGGDVEIVDNGISKSKTAPYAQKITVKATPFNKDAKYTFSFDRWIEKDSDGKYHDIYDNVNIHNQTMTITIRKDITLVACFNVYDKTGQLMYHRDHEIMAEGITPTVTVQKVGLTGASLNFFIQHDFGDRYYPQENFHAGVLVGQIPCATKEMMQQYPNLIFNHDFGKEINKDFVGSDVNIPIELDLKPDTFYIIRPYMYNDVSIVYGDDVHVVTDIVPYDSKMSERVGLPGLHQTMPVGGRFEDQLCPYVRFAPGNLQYCPLSNKWRFAEKQWHFVGKGDIVEILNDDESIVSSNSDNHSKKYEGWIDLFGWGTSGYYYHGASRWYYGDINDIQGYEHYSMFNAYPISHNYYATNPDENDLMRAYTINSSIPWSTNTKPISGYTEGDFAEYNAIMNSNNVYYWWNNDSFLYQNQDGDPHETQVSHADDWNKQRLMDKYDLDATEVLEHADWLLWDTISDDNKKRIFIWANYGQDYEPLRSTPVNAQIDTVIGQVANGNTSYIDSHTMYPAQTFESNADFDNRKYDTRWYLVTPDFVNTMIYENDINYAYGYGPGMLTSRYMGQTGLFGAGYGKEPATKHLDWGYDNAIGDANPGDFRVFRDYFYQDNGDKVHIVSKKTEAEYWLEHTRHINASVAFGRSTVVYGHIFLPINWHDKYFTEEYYNEVVEYNSNIADDPQYMITAISGISLEDNDGEVVQLTSEQLDILTNYGVVFLPNGGYRNGDTVLKENEVAAYWTGVTGLVSSDRSSLQNAMDLIYGRKKPQATGYANFNKRYIGKSVRLVRNGFFDGVRIPCSYYDNPSYGIAQADDPDMNADMSIAGLIGNEDYTMFKLSMAVKNTNDQYVEYATNDPQYGSISGVCENYEQGICFDGGVFIRRIDRKVQQKQTLWIEAQEGYEIQKITMTRGATAENNYTEQVIYASSEYDTSSFSDNIEAYFTEFRIKENAENKNSAFITLQGHNSNFIKVNVNIKETSQN